eukprot:GHRQ01022239.1.p2 GENE.GHRQ01022239.1~~GHRQ01022239.1.p2  ORF type:complete len:125 (+),score=68.17 GHRQ01022239.1:327-701(+)
MWPAAAVNFLGGTSMASLGAGEQVTKVSTGLVAYVVMELTRYAKNEAAEPPAAGSTGNTIGQAGDELRGMFESCHEALLKAAAAGKCELEDSKKVALTTCEDLGSWRKLNTTIEVKDQAAIMKK